MSNQQNHNHKFGTHTHTNRLKGRGMGETDLNGAENQTDNQTPNYSAPQSLYQLINAPNLVNNSV